MSIVDISLQQPDYPRKDALEEQIEQLLIHAPKKTLFGQRIISGKRHRSLALVARRVSLTGKKCVVSASEYRQRKFFANKTVGFDTLQLKRSMEIYDRLLASKQQDALERITEGKKSYKERKKRLDQAQTLLKSGYDKAAIVYRAGEKVDGLKISGYRKFKKSLKKGAVSDSVAVEGTYWSGIGVKCYRMDMESEKLCLLRRKLIELDSRIETVEENESNRESFIALRNERATIHAQIMDQSKTVEDIERDLTLGTLNALTKEGSECAESIQKILKDGLQACISVKSTVTGIGLAGSLLSFAVSLDTIVSNGNSLDKMESCARAIRTYLKSPTGKTDLSTVLINNMYALKLDHLNRSSMKLRDEAKAAAAVLVSSTLSAGKFSFALATLAATTVLAAPGLNIAAVTLAALTSIGLQGFKLYNAIKYDKEGVKLDVQIAEESAQIVAYSGEFYSNVIEFDVVRSEIEALMPIEADIKSSIRLIRRCRVGFSGDSEAEDFYQELEDGLQEDLLPISQKKLENQVKYDLLQSELYNASVRLDKSTVYKRRLQEDRSMEALAAEFTGAIKKSDIIAQYKLFKELLSNDTVRFRFLDFLSREGIPVVSDDFIFEAVLGFIRNDKHVPRSMNPSD